MGGGGLGHMRVCLCVPVYTLLGYQKMGGADSRK